MLVNEWVYTAYAWMYKMQWSAIISKYFFLHSNGKSLNVIIMVTNKPDIDYIFWMNGFDLITCKTKLWAKQKQIRIVCNKVFK